MGDTDMKSNPAIGSLVKIRAQTRPEDKYEVLGITESGMVTLREWRIGGKVIECRLDSILERDKWWERG